MGETIEMSQKERDRLVELRQVERGAQQLVEAARRLGLSYRQTKRVWRRYRESGVQGLVHRSRGRPSNRGKPAELRRRCLELYQERYDGFGPTLAAEKLAKEGLAVDHETLRRWLVAEGLWTVRRKRSKHRRWRQRKLHFGEMVQLDGSHHDWFSCGRRDCLMGMIDDATGVRLTRLSSEETTADAMWLLWRWIETFGIPRSLYLDKKSVYHTERKLTLDEQLAGHEEPATVFGQACRRLGIELITAHSPQAKGRIERSHAVYQDRLVKEIRLEALAEYESVNVLLESFDAELNARFAVEPVEPQDLHQKVPRGLDLADVFVDSELRTVQNDWTVRYKNRWFQIGKATRRRPPAKSKVEVRRRLDGSLTIVYRGRPVAFDVLTGRPETPATKPMPKNQPKPTWTPAPDHPWRYAFSDNAPSRRSAKAQGAG
jgi:transposase